MTDKIIIEGLIAGDETAYRYLYTNHYQSLCFYAYGFTGDHQIAEMIVSDVIFHIWSNRQELHINQSFRGYLMTAVKNRCLNYFRTLNREQSIESKYDLAETDNNPLTQLLEKELDLLIDSRIEALPELTRDIFELSRFDNKKYEEIAFEKKVSVDVVKYHIKLALKQLRKQLKDYLYLLSFILFP